MRGRSCEFIWPHKFFILFHENADYCKTPVIAVFLGDLSIGSNDVETYKCL